MARAEWNGTIIAESDDFEVVEGNIYFPPQGINNKFFKKSDNKTTCFWKGVASYYNIEVDGKTNQNAAWYYPDPSAKANNIKDYVAFWKGVTVTR